MIWPITIKNSAKASLLKIWRWFHKLHFMRVYILFNETIKLFGWTLKAKPHLIACFKGLVQSSTSALKNWKPSLMALGLQLTAYWIVGLNGDVFWAASWNLSVPLGSTSPSRNVSELLFRISNSLLYTR